MLPLEAQRDAKRGTAEDRIFLMQEPRQTMFPPVGADSLGHGPGDLVRIRSRRVRFMFH